MKCEIAVEEDGKVTRMWFFRGFDGLLLPLVFTIIYFLVVANIEAIA